MLTHWNARHLTRAAAGFTIALAMLLSATVRAETEPGRKLRSIAYYSQALRGDLNSDGVLDVQDIAEMMRLVTSPDAVDDAARARGDLNDDGRIDADDLAALLHFIAGFVPPGGCPAVNNCCGLIVAFGGCCGTKACGGPAGPAMTTAALNSRPAGVESAASAGVTIHPASHLSIRQAREALRHPRHPRPVPPTSPLCTP